MRKQPSAFLIFTLTQRFDTQTPPLIQPSEEYTFIISEEVMIFDTFSS